MFQIIWLCSCLLLLFDQQQKDCSPAAPMLFSFSFKHRLVRSTPIFPPHQLYSLGTQQATTGEGICQGFQANLCEIIGAQGQNLHSTWGLETTWQTKACLKSNTQKIKDLDVDFLTFGKSNWSPPDAVNERKVPAAGASKATTPPSPKELPGRSTARFRLEDHCKMMPNVSCMVNSVLILTQEPSILSVQASSQTANQVAWHTFTYHVQ